MRYSLDLVGLAGGWLVSDGTQVDISAFGGNGVLVGSNKKDFAFRGGSWGYKPGTIGGAIQIADSAALRPSQGSFVIFTRAGFDVLDTTQRRFISKRGIGLINYEIGNFSSTELSFSTIAGLGADFNLGSSTYLVDKKFIGITQAAGVGRPKLYIDGLFHSSGAIDRLLGVTDNPDLFLANLYTLNAPQLSFIEAYLIYGVEKTADEMAEIYAQLMCIYCPVFGRSYFVPAQISSRSYQDIAFVGDMRDDQVIDISGNNFHFIKAQQSIINATSPVMSPELKFNKGVLSAGDKTLLDYTAGYFGGWFWLTLDTLPGSSCLVCKGSASDRGYYIGISAANKVEATINNGDEPIVKTQTVTAATALAQSRRYLVGVFFGQYLIVYYSNKIVGGPTARLFDPKAASGFEFILGQYQAATSPGAILGNIGGFEFGAFLSQAHFEEEMRAAYTLSSLSHTLLGDWGALAVTDDVFSTGQFVYNSGINVVSGSVKIVAEKYNGRWCKYVQSTATSLLKVAHREINSAFGTWTFYFSTAATANLTYIYLIGDTVIPSAGYFFGVYNDNSVILYKLGVGFKFRSIAGYIQNGVVYKATITRHVDGGEFAIYINDVLVPAASGSNPTGADTTTVVSSCVGAYLSSGDKLLWADELMELSFRKQFG